MADADSTDAFALLTDETRLAIVEELAGALREGPPGTLAFSDLRERVGMRDSGQFHYHLEKMVGTFVEKDGDGYKLSYAGLHVAAAVLSGHYGEAIDGFEEELPDPCPACGEPLFAEYEDGLLAVGCDNDHRFGNLVPPLVFEGRDLEEVADLVALTSIGGIRTAQFGACPQCYGHVEWSMEAPPDDAEAPYEEPLHLLAQCQTCGAPYSAVPGSFALWDPAVQPAVAEAGVDVWANPARWIIESQAATVESYDRDAGRTTVSLAVADHRLVATTDRRGRVLEFDLSPADG